MADALANLTVNLTLLKDETVHVPICHKWVLAPLSILQQEEVNATLLFTIDSEDWRQPLIDYLEHGKLPDELRPITPKSSAGHAYILATTDYFSKWAEVVPLKEVKKENVVNFIRKAVLPLERQIPSLRIVIHEGLTDEDNAKLRLQGTLRVLSSTISRAFNKNVHLRSFQINDLVLAIHRPIITTQKTRSKFTSKWDGPYVVQEVYTNGAYKIVVEDGLRIDPINGEFLKRYYA
ncbi:hypothetical protein AAG906_016953 [Vitis piasezkii]